MSDQASQSQEAQEVDVAAILERDFGIKPQEAQRDEATEEDNLDELDDVDEKDTPAKEESANVRKVKFNKKEVEIPEDQIEDLLQKGLALEKERERKSELEKSLQRAAKLNGYDSVEDYLANLDNLEKQSVQKQKDQFSDLTKRLRQEFEDAGLDPEKAEAYINSLPEIQEARKLLEREEKRQANSKEEQAKERSVKEWQALFTKYPELADETSEDGTEAPWLTSEMQKRIDRGYSPIDAYELVYRDKIVEQEKEKARQSVLKDQRLRKRSKVEGNAPSDRENDDPNLDRVKGAFAMFGLDPRKAKNFITK